MLRPVRASFASGRPLRWNRVNQLPDFTYFNHSIHVAKGVACAECHGRVDRMPLMAQARDLAKCLGKNRVVLIRGGGFVVTGRSLNDAVRISVYIPRNARVIAMAKPFGRMVGLSKGESAKRVALDPDSNAMRRGWEYWARQAGCGDLLAD